MKKICFLCFLCVYTFCSAQQISKNVDSLVYNYIKEMNVPDFWLYRLDKIVPKNTNIPMIKGGIQSPPYEVYCYFIDEEPNANWEHKCRYVFVNALTHSIIAIQSKTPPNNLEKWAFLSEIKPQTTGKLFDFSNNKSMKVAAASSTSTSGSNKYAVIISGGSDNYNNWIRYWNDCSAMYKALKNIYGYTDDHIYVLMSDGISSGADRHVSGNVYDSSPLDLDNDGVNDIKYSATKSNIDIVFNELSSKLTSNDCLFVFTTDHGGYENGDDVYMYLWGETMRDDEFAQEVNKVNAGIINIVMEQCHSGGFIADLAKNNRTIATACTAAETSNSTSDNLYDEFVFRWISAVCGKTPDGTVVNADLNLDGKVSMQEAFLYAKNNDTKLETPQYSSTPSLLGQQVSLFWTTISGPSQICTQGTYTVDATGATVLWSATPTGIVSLQQSGNSVTITKVGNGNVTLSATINNSVTVTKDIWVGVPSTPLGILNFSNGDLLGNYSVYDFALNYLGDEGVNQFNWTVTGGTILSGQGTNTIEIRTAKRPKGAPNYVFDVNVKVGNACGWSNNLWVTGFVTSGSNGPAIISLAPNPSSDQVEVSISDAVTTNTLLSSSAESLTATSYQISVVDSNGSVVYSATKKEKKFNIQTSSLRNGVYAIKVSDGINTYQNKLIVNH